MGNGTTNGRVALLALHGLRLPLSRHVNFRAALKRVPLFWPASGTGMSAARDAAVLSPVIAAPCRAAVSAGFRRTGS